jgi:Domain of unknown function (DUF5925)
MSSSIGTEKPAFHAIVAANGFKVSSAHELAGKREQLRPDSVDGRSILWCQYDRRRSHLLGWPEDDAIVLIKQGSATVEVLVAHNDLDAARKILAEIDRLLPREPISGDTVLPIMFWHQSQDGVEATIRCIELVHWADLAPNYAEEPRTRLSSLMEGFKPAKNDGRLLLWHGEPGTGKTFAIRSLAWAWRDWCRFEYVIDPEQLFGKGSYPTEVVLNRMPGHLLFEDKPDSEWRLLIVEDSGEMMAMDGRANRAGVVALAESVRWDPRSGDQDPDPGHDKRGSGQSKSRDSAARPLRFGN